MQSMSPSHHIDDATLLSYSAGALGTALSVVVAAHLWLCAACRKRLAAADALGGILLQQLAPPAIDAAARDRMLSALAAEPVRHDGSGVHNLRPGTAQASTDASFLPAPLRPYFGERYSDLRWRCIGPGVQIIRARSVDDGNLMLLRTAPGSSVPMHSHTGNELTLILQGAYDDVLGHFAPGDFADLDGSTTHQPVTSQGVPCVCAAATDAPLHFDGWLARTLQPLVGL